MRLSREQVLRYRMHRQGLFRHAEQPSILQLGVQHHGQSVSQALAARLEHPEIDSQALAWTYRGAPHAHRELDLPELAAALLPRSERDAAARLSWSKPQVQRCGMPAAEAIDTVAAIAREVITAPMTKGAASTAITERIPSGLGYDCHSCRAFHVYEQLMRVAMLPAGIELDREAPKPVLTPRAGWRRPHRPLPAAAVRRYLRFLGPATIKHVAAFLGADEQDLAAAWPEDLVECTVDGEDGYYLTEEPGELPEDDIVRLLPPFDPYLQARDRERLVPNAQARKRLWRILGNPGALLVDGEILGAWQARVNGNKLTVTVERFAPVSAPVRRDAEAEAHRLARLRGTATVHVEWTG